MPTAKSLILIGFKASGKTTVGQMLAKDLAYGFLDTDALLCLIHQHTHISELYRNCGEIQFRKLESRLLQTIDFEASQVIATGGGIVINDDNCCLLSQVGSIIYLHTSLESIKKRLMPAADCALFQQQDMDTMYYQRLALYERHANLIVKTDNKTPQQVVDEIKQHLGLANGK